MSELTGENRWKVKTVRTFILLSEDLLKKLYFYRKIVRLVFIWTYNFMTFVYFPIVTVNRFVLYQLSHLKKDWLKC